MASYTKLYPHSSFHNPNDPPWFNPSTFQAGWSVNPSGSPANAALIGYDAGTNGNFASRTEAVATTGLTYGIYRWTSGPLLAGTTGGTVDMVMGVRESDAAANFATRVYIYITQGASDSVRGVVLNFTDSDEWPTTAEGFNFSSPQSCGVVNYQAGDRLVIEFGYVANNASTTPYEGRVWAGGFWDDPDLTVGGLNVTAERGFFEFSTPILIDDPTPDTGDIIVNNEESYFYDNSTGELKRTLLDSSNLSTLPDPSNGLQLSDGTWVFPTEATTAELIFYSAAFAVQGVVDLSPGTRARSLTLDSSDNIYIGFRGNSNTSPSDATSNIQKRDNSGALLDSYTPDRHGGPGFSSIDMASDGETLYMVNRGRTVETFNVNTLAQATLVTLPTESGPTYGTAAKAYGIRLLPNDEALVADLIDIKRISTIDGTILQRYTYPNIEDWQHVSIGVGATTFAAATIGAPDSSAIANVQGATGPGTPLVVKFDLETGAVLFELLQDVDPDTGGSQRGITTTDGWAPVPDGDGSIIVIKRVCPNTDTTAFDFVAGGGLSPGTFSLTHNQQQSFLGLTPGDGYSIEETPLNPNFLPPIYEVSNGSQIDNLTVAEGEIVTVTVTNHRLVVPEFEIEEDPRVWERTAPIISSENRRVFYNLFFLDCQVGTGQSSGLPENVDPQVMMTYSDDSGLTWSNELWRSMGRIGKYLTRLEWWRLGMARNRVFRVRGSAAVRTLILDGGADIDPSTDAPKS